MQTLLQHRAVTVLVDNNSSDGTAAAAHAAFPDLSVLTLPRNVGAFGRTVGARAAHTEYVAFADDDSWWSPGSLRGAADILASYPAVAAVAARILVGPQEQVDPISTVMARSPLPRASSGHPTLLGFVACGTVVRRSAFLDVGGFDQVVRFPGEEERVALDLVGRGHQIVYADALSVHHHPSPRRHSPDARITAVTRSSILTTVMRLPAASSSSAPDLHGAHRRRPAEVSPVMPCSAVDIGWRSRASRWPPRCCSEFEGGPCLDRCAGSPTGLVSRMYPSHRRRRGRFDVHVDHDRVLTGPQVRRVRWLRCRSARYQCQSPGNGIPTPQGPRSTRDVRAPRCPATDLSPMPHGDPASKRTASFAMPTWRCSTWSLVADGLRQTPDLDVQPLRRLVTNQSMRHKWPRWPPGITLVRGCRRAVRSMTRAGSGRGSSAARAEARRFVQSFRDGRPRHR